ncbi:hypothetical protein FPCIR_5589 [Fusarium pseudocircinatum]|uniref:Uncharacterized protein n=1 Tax=Fusarium pseudocircinatum TaxID=56676 RepID=A0A8H5ULN6_9HYPO|nr:hypothetical protein FPCIR_5589 [Fusarium pseudocircinatum]
MSPNKIENRTNSHILDVRFELEHREDEMEEAFRPRIMAILQIDNDGEGFLTKNPIAACQLNCILVLWVLPEIFISLGVMGHIKVTTTLNVIRPPQASTPS